MTLFVDTSTWYAAADHGDANNGRAKEVLTNDEALVTTDHILVETWLLIHHRLGKQPAGRFWEGIRGGVAHVEVVTSVDLESAWSIGAIFPDQDFSIVDRTSFAVMERLGLCRAAALKDDFAIYRFGSRRERSFEVVR